MARTRGENDDPEPLLIDRRAAAEVPTDAAVEEWAVDKRVFVSSVMAELAEERRAAAEAIRAVGARPVLFEDFGGRDADAERAYIPEVETSSIYLGILGRRYGKPLPTRFSPTHTEYRHALESGLRIAVWTLDTADREGHQQAFLDEIRVFHVVPSFDSPEDLRRQVEERLRTIAAEDLAPWVKLGRLVFRAREVTQGGETIRIKARVHSDDVAHALEGLAPGRYGRGEPVRLTWGGRSRDVQMAEVECTTTTAKSKMIQLTVEEAEGSRDRAMEWSFNGMSADDLTQVTLETTLLRKRDPIRERDRAFLPSMPDPLRPLREATVADEIVRPLAELLIVDELVGSGRAARVTDFRLGASVGGKRRLQLTWEPPRRYTNQRAERRTIDGQVEL